jgi:hypothetical protein
MLKNFSATFRRQLSDTDSFKFTDRQILSCIIGFTIHYLHPLMNQTTKIVTEFYRVAHAHPMEENDSVEYQSSRLTVYEIYEGVVVF